MSFTAHEKLAEVENLIMEYRWALAGTREHRSALVLKAVAADLRGRMPGVPGTAALSLDRRINAAKIARNGAPHYPTDHLIGLGQEIIGRWPTVRQALEQFETAVQEAE